MLDEMCEKIRQASRGTYHPSQNMDVVSGWGEIVADSAVPCNSKDLRTSTKGSMWRMRSFMLKSLYKDARISVIIERDHNLDGSLILSPIER